MLLSRWAFVCDVCPTSRRMARNDLQGGSALPIRSHCGAVWGISGHNFIWDARAMPHKNICDFAGNDRDGNLHNKSSHAPVKTANKFQLYCRVPTCITCQVTLSVGLRLFSYYIFKEPLAISASHAVVVGGFRPPVPAYRPFGLPFFQAALPGIRFMRCIRVFLNSVPIIPRRRRKTRRSYRALSAL